MLTVDAKLKEKYPNTFFGLLVVDGFAPTQQGVQAFEAHAQQQLQNIRSRYEGCDKKQIAEINPAIAAYVKYYKKFKKSYHVLLQTESVLKGRELPQSLAAAQVLLLTELQTGMLLAGHDCSSCKFPLTAVCAEGNEQYTGAAGNDIAVKSNDIIVKDEQGIILSIIYGQDQRTRMTDASQKLMYIINGVPDTDRQQYAAAMELLEENLKLLCPQLTVKVKEII